MPKIIREKYENGVLVERHVEGSKAKPWRWLMLAAHSIIAISLAVLALIAVHDSMVLGNALFQDETALPACGHPGIRS
jgi:hypothetical protein